MSDSWASIGAASTSASEVHVYESASLHDRLVVSVALPPGYERDDERFETLYVLDPSAMFDVVVRVSRNLAVLAREHFPRLLVVGVGYDTESQRRISALRGRDMTPTESPPTPGVMSPGPFSDGTGGAPRLLASMRDEVIPGIEARYRTATGRRTIVGWSLGGLFGLYALFTDPALFARYLLVSPSIWWDGAWGLRGEEQWAATNSDLPAEVFVAVGELEETDVSRSWPPGSMSAEGVASAAMVSNVLELDRRLRSRAYQGLSLETVVLPNEHHITVMPTAISRGLMSLFASR